MTHLLVTNDFPPKIGGIQSYLWELWRRLPPEHVAVLTTPYGGDDQFDASQPYRIERTREPVLLPTPSLARRIDALADEVDARVVFLDPALPVGLLGRRLRHDYGVILHGAEVTVPRRIPVVSAALRSVLSGAVHVIAAGNYPAAEAVRSAGPATPPVTVVPPGVDCERFRPLTADERARARVELGLPADGLLITSVSRLVPRKGMDVLIAATARLARDRPDLHLAIAGTGRDRDRLQRLADRHRAPVTFLGKVPLDRLPAVYGCGDVFAMLCRNRWGGLEQEGFGVVFVEAAACGVPQVAGDSGGASDAVVDGETGLVVHNPTEPAAVATALAGLLDDDARRARLGAAARARVERDFANDVIARRLDDALAALEHR